jgi:hypothetical protein
MASKCKFDSWKIRRAHYDIVSNDRLTDMLVTSIDDAWAPPRREAVSKRRRTATNLVRLLGGAVGAAVPPIVDAPIFVAPDTDSDEVDAAPEEEEFVDIHPVLLEDVVDTILEGGCDVDVGPPETDEQAFSEGDYSDDDHESGEPDDDERRANREARALEDHMADSRVSFTGYLTSTIEPYAGIPMLCRITYRPIEMPPEKQVITCKCFRHRNCRLGRSHHRWSEQMMLRWFWLGMLRAAPDADAHLALAREIAP